MLMQGGSAAPLVSTRRRAPDRVLLGARLLWCLIRVLASRLGDVTHDDVAACRYWCLAGSVASTARACGDISVYCPEGSTAPTSAPQGYYTYGGANETVQKAVFHCPVGGYCVAGRLYVCPAGRYGDALGLNSSSCSGNCSAGSVPLGLLGCACAVVCVGACVLACRSPDSSRCFFM